MKVLLDIKNSKFDFVMELLKNLSFVKVTPLSAKKSKEYQELKEAVEEVQMAKEGKVKLKKLDDFLDEL